VDSKIYSSLPRTNFARRTTAMASPAKPLFVAGHRESFSELIFKIMLISELDGKICAGFRLAFLKRLISSYPQVNLNGVDLFLT